MDEYHNKKGIQSSGEPHPLDSAWKPLMYATVQNSRQYPCILVKRVLDDKYGAPASTLTSQRRG